jgi:hypothetical protein
MHMSPEKYFSGYKVLEIIKNRLPIQYIFSVNATGLEVKEKQRMRYNYYGICYLTCFHRT